MSQQWKLWAADPHRFGPGKVHLIDDESPSKTFCGKIMSEFPGRQVSTGEATCKICRDAPRRRAEYRERSEQWRAESEARQKAEAERYLEWQEQQESEKAAWRTRYNEHIRSQKWRDIRQRVIKRAGGLCEGCALAPPMHVHHISYEHMGDEFLWELRAVCIECHRRAHPEREIG